MTEIESDYLIVGVGASGMAFADALIAEGYADVVMVERLSVLDLRRASPLGKLAGAAAPTMELIPSVGLLVTRFSTFTR